MPRVFLLPLLSFLLFACEPETVTLTPVEPEGSRFSGPTQLSFADWEVEVLNERLALNSTIEPLVTHLPAHLASSGDVLEQDESSARKALLGRVLFYDNALSATGETSCASCHHQELAFGDPKAFSDGINGNITKRNSIALGSVAAFAPDISGYGASGDDLHAGVEGRVKFFWDGRAATVKEQSEQTIQDELEMGKDLHELSDELRNQEMYRILTMKAFGTTDLSPDRITLALEHFIQTMTALDTRFDRHRDGHLHGLQSDFTPLEETGELLFLNSCANCHGFSFTEPIQAVANNGLDEVSVDKGVGALTGSTRDNGVFKVPFLRNIELTAPYMHDGRFETLREVIDHYSEGIQDHLNLHPLLKDENFNAKRFDFSEGEKEALIAYLKTVTDHSLAEREDLKDPFRR